MTAVVEIQIADASLAEAAQASADGGEFWLATMPAVLFHYAITPTAYWELSVAEHRALYDYLVFRNVPVGVDDGSG